MVRPDMPNILLSHNPERLFEKFRLP
jgi:hypothetical protein